MIRGAAVLLVGLLGCAGAVYAIDSQPAFEDPTLQARYVKLIHELRCLVCQNETIADSNADLAAELRRSVHQMIAKGQSDRQILDFLKARYGDFVLYRPPLEPKTWLLWGAPGILLVIGALVFVHIVRQRASQPMDEDAA